MEWPTQRIRAFTPGRGDAQSRIASCEELIAREEGSTATAARVRVARALVDRGEALLGLHRYDDALRSFGEVLERCCGQDAEELRGCATRALRRQALVLMHLDRSGAAHRNIW
jgi:hypothetical protein